MSETAFNTDRDWPLLAAAQRDKIARLERALLSVYSLATSEQENPTGLHMTCLSLIQKQAASVLDLSKHETSQEG